MFLSGLENAASKTEPHTVGQFDLRPAVGDYDVGPVLQPAKTSSLGS